MNRFWVKIEDEKYQLYDKLEEYSFNSCSDEWFVSQTRYALNGLDEELDSIKRPRIKTDRFIVLDDGRRDNIILDRLTNKEYSLTYDWKEICDLMNRLDYKKVVG